MTAKVSDHNHPRSEIHRDCQACQSNGYRPLDTEAKEALAERIWLLALADDILAGATEQTPAPSSATVPK